MSQATPFAPATDATPLLQIKLDLPRFVNDWSHCDQLSNYIARSVCMEKSDPFLYANLLSTIINEVLESVFRHHAPEGKFVISISHTSPDTLVEALIPVSPEACRFYTGTVDKLASNDPEQLYRESLVSTEGPDEAIGFYELASSYRAAITTEVSPDKNAVRLSISVRIDEVLEAAIA